MLFPQNKFTLQKNTGMKIYSRYIEDELYEGSNENGNTSRQDMRPADQKVGLSPVETLLSCLASCVAVEVVTIIKKKRKTFIDLSMEIDATRRETHPKSLTHIHLHTVLVSPDTDANTLDKTVKLVLDNYCSVASSLNVPIEYSVEVKEA